MKKKGVELSINVIIIAAIAIVVLIILFAILTGRMTLFSAETSQTCAQKDGKVFNLRGTGPCDTPVGGVFDSTKCLTALGQCPTGNQILAAKLQPGEVCCKAPT